MVTPQVTSFPGYVIERSPEQVERRLRCRRRQRAAAAALAALTVASADTSPASKGTAEDVYPPSTRLMVTAADLDHEGLMNMARLFALLGQCAARPAGEEST